MPLAGACAQSRDKTDRQKQIPQTFGRPSTAPPVAETQLAPLPPPEKNVSSLIEFSSEARQDPNEGRVFGDTPVHCKCPHCERSVITFIDRETSWVTLLLAFVVWLSLGRLAIWILPLLWPAFKDVVHHCPRCLNVIERKSRIKLPAFKSEVMTCKVAGCAVVLARKYVIITCCLIFLIIGSYVLRWSVPLSGQHVEKGLPSTLLWEDFVKDFGQIKQFRTREAVARSYDSYTKRTFVWQGEVQQIREGFDVLFFRTKSVVMVNMYPARPRGRGLPDIALFFGDDRNEEVAELSVGDWVEFEATMTARGYRGDPEVMALWRITKTKKPSSLPNRPAPDQITDVSLFGRFERSERQQQMPPPLPLQPRLSSPLLQPLPPLVHSAVPQKPLDARVAEKQAQEVVPGTTVNTELARTNVPPAV
eukprot:TRINITY_DN33821_c0_g2_i1.p1 TRINITY_DN33821_c0_g2~~TRINITY_DN33821_c0_g2_i1.p1  ORF type:complete len:420 (+),score=65.16 TRINITY_DN33821_c0_g2_i1:129-1388(+)